MQEPHSLHDVARHFCIFAGDIICQWEILRRLAKHHEEDDTLKAPRFGHFFHYINGAIIDGLFLAVGRLHDPACSQGHANLSVNFLMEHPELASGTREKLETLTTTMADFAKIVKDPRNKLLAHNDLASIALSGNMGDFLPCRGDIYIECLRQFARTVSEDIRSEPFTYDDIAANDVSAVVRVLALGLQTL